MKDKTTVTVCTAFKKAIDDLVLLVREYDCTLDYCDDPSEVERGERNNKAITAKFIEICASLGISANENDCALLSLDSALVGARYKNAEEAVNAYVAEHKVTIAGVSKEGNTMDYEKKLLNNALTVVKMQDKNYVTKDMLANAIENLTGKRPRKAVSRDKMIVLLQRAIDEETTAATKVEASVDDLSVAKDSTEVAANKSTQKTVNTIPVFNLTKEQRILVAKNIKEACLNTKMKSAGVSLCDAQNVICNTLFGKKYYKFRSVVTGVIGVDRMGNEIYSYKTDRISQVNNIENAIIDNTLIRMVAGNCLKPNREGTYYFLTGKLFNWNFVE